LTIDQLGSVHVYRWVDAQPGWKTSKRGAMTAVQRAFNWAAKAGLLKSVGGTSPLAALEKPAQGRREQLVSEAEYREVLGLVKDQEFVDLLELSWETGCRPHELFTVEAAYADLPTGRWVFPVRLSKGKKVQRVVYLSDRALAITRRLVLTRPTGPLLVNTEGRPWCASAVKCRFQKLCRAVGRRRLGRSALVPPPIPRLTAAQRGDSAVRQTHEEKVRARRKQVAELARQHGLRVNLYAFRHTLITESLVRGLDAVTVSVLAGHRGTAMIARHYAHLDQRHDHLRAAANRVRGA
jgi:integrase